jgi:hypothetical protein
MEPEGKVYGGDAEEGERGSPSVRWVSGSGPLGCFVLLWAPCGPLAPLIPVGDRGRPLYFPGLPLPWSLLSSVGFGRRPWRRR